MVTDWLFSVMNTGVSNPGGNLCVNTGGTRRRSKMLTAIKKKILFSKKTGQQVDRPKRAACTLAIHCHMREIHYKWKKRAISQNLWKRIRIVG